MPKSTKKNLLVKKFGRASVTYDEHAGIHREIASYLMTHAVIPPVNGKVLELGAGTGVLSELLRKRFHGKDVVCLDLSGDMLEVLQQKWPECNKIQADMSFALPFKSELFSLLFSSTALQWAGDEDNIRNLIINNLQPGARFIIAVVVKGTFSLLHQVRDSIDPYIPPPLPDFAGLKAALNLTPLMLSRQEQHTFRDTFMSSEQLFDAIRGLGISGSSKSGLSKDNFQELKDRYHAACKELGSLPFLDYRIGFFWGEKSPAK